MKNKNEILGMNSVFIGARFIYRTVEILGPDYTNSRRPSFEGQVLTVVGFKPRYVNKVVLQQPNGEIVLMPLEMVEKGLSIEELRPPSDNSGPSQISNSGTDLAACLLPKSR